MIAKKDWMLTTKDIYLRSDFDSKDDIKDLGGMYDGEKKRWFIPRGVNPLDFRSYWAVLDCPFEEKDKVKRRGARFDKSIKKWVVPERFDYDHFTKYWPSELKKFLINDAFAIYSITTVSGQSTIYEAYNINTNERVAIKLFDDSEKNERVREAFNRELKTLTETIPEHDFILEILDWGQHEASGNYFIVTPHYPFDLSDFTGKNKKEIIQMVLEKDYDFDPENEDDRIQLEEAILKHSKGGNWLYYKDRLFLPMLDALCLAYDHKVIHRDIKPANIFVEFDIESNHFDFVLGDFGISKARDKLVRTKNTVIDIRSEPYGPVRTKEEKKFQETWDGYGWAAIVVSLVTEKSIYTDEDLMDIVANDFGDLVPKAIYAIILKCLLEKPSDRPKNVKKIREILEKYDAW